MIMLISGISGKQTPPRIFVVNWLASSKMGTGDHDPRTFYTRASRSMIDYLALALLQLTIRQQTALETIQNKAVRTILASSRWSRFDNLSQETKLPSLLLRIQQITSGYMAKAFLLQMQFFIRNKIISVLKMKRNIIPGRMWPCSPLSNSCNK